MLNLRRKSYLSCCLISLGMQMTMVAAIELPEPTISHIKCDQDAKARVQDEFKELGTVLECYTRIEKWTFVGRAAVLLPHSAESSVPFDQLKKRIFAEQTAFIEKSRAIDTDDGSKPQHGTVPKSLFTGRHQGLGVFAESD